MRKIAARVARAALADRPGERRVEAGLAGTAAPRALVAVGLPAKAAPRVLVGAGSAVKATPRAPAQLSLRAEN